MLKTKTLIAFCFVVAIFITLNASANTQNQNFKGEVLGAIAPGNAHTIASLPSSDNNDNFTSSQNIPTDELESAINVKDGELVGDDSFAARLSSNETYFKFQDKSGNDYWVKTTANKAIAQQSDAAITQTGEKTTVIPSDTTTTTPNTTATVTPPTDILSMVTESGATPSVTITPKLTSTVTASATPKPVVSATDSTEKNLEPKDKAADKIEREKIQWNDVVTGVDVEQKLYQNKIKETITVKDSGAPTTFEFNLSSSDNLKIVQGGGVHNLVNAQTNEKLGQIEDAFALDANGKKYDFQYVLSGTTLTLSPKDDISQAAYPLVIDPTYVIQNGSITTSAWLESNNQRKLVRASNGDLCSIYIRYDGNENGVYSAKSTDGGQNWAETAVYKPFDGYDQDHAALAIDSANNLYAVWEMKNADHGISPGIGYSKFNGSSWSAAAMLTNETYSQERPAIAVDSSDNIHVAWDGASAALGGSTYVLRYIKNSGSWGAIQNLTPTSDGIQSYASIAIDNNNYVHIAWRGRNPSSTTYSQIRYIKYTNSWSAAANLTSESYHQYQPSIAVDSSGNPVIAWDGQYSGSTTYRQIHCLRYSGGGWNAMENLTAYDAYEGYEPTVSIDYSDNINVLWFDGFGYVLSKTYSGSWGGIVDVISSGSNTKVNSIWANYPVVSGAHTNRPTAGYAFTFANSNSAKYFASDTLGWVDPAGLTISGTVYTAEDKSANIGANKTIGLSVNGAAKTTVETTAGGAFSFAGVSANANDTITLFEDDEGTEEAVLVSQTSASDMTDLELYTSHISIDHQTAGPMTNTLLDTADNCGDDDLEFSVSGTAATFNSGFEVWVTDGKTYTPGGTVSADDMEVRGTGTFAPVANTVTLTGDWTMSATGTLTTSGTFIFAGSGVQTINSGGASLNNITISNTSAAVSQLDAVTIVGTLTTNNGAIYDINGQNITLATLANNGTFRLQGGETTVTITSPDTTHGTVEYIGTGSYTGLKYGNSYNNLKFSAAGTWALNASITMAGVYQQTAGTINSGNDAYTISSATMSISGGTLAVAAQTSNRSKIAVSGAFDQSGGALSAGYKAQMAFSSFALSGGTFTIASGYLTFVTLNCANDFTITGGTFDNQLGSSGSAAKITVGGNYSQATGTYNHNNSGILDIVGAFTLSSAGSFTMGSGANLYIGGNFDMSGNTSAIGGTITLDGNSASFAPSTLSMGSIYFAKTAGQTVTINGDITTSGYFQVTSGNISAGSHRVTMTGGSTRLNLNDQILYDLTIANDIFIYTNDAQVSHSLTVNASETLTIQPSRTLTLLDGASTTIADTGSIGGSGMIIFKDSAGANLGTTGNLGSTIRFDAATSDVAIPARIYRGNVQFYNNTASNYKAVLGTAGGQTVTFGNDSYIGNGAITILANSTGNMTLDGATYDPTVTTITPTTDSDWHSGGLYFAGTGDGIEYVLAGDGTWSLRGGIDLTGGTFTAGGSTFVLNGRSSNVQTVTSAGNSFNNLTVANTTASGVTFADALTVSGTFADTTASSKINFATSGTHTINNLSLNGGAEGTRITVAPAAATTTWNLGVSGTQSVSYVSVSYSDASAGDTIDATNGTNFDGDHNINWSFIASFSVSGTVFSAENESTNIGANKTIGLSINGAAKTTVETGAGGTFNFTDLTSSANDTITIFEDDETGEQANLVTQETDGSTNITSLKLYTNKVVLSHATAGPMTNTLLDTADNCGDDDLEFSVSGTAATFNSGFEVWVTDGKTYTPGGTVSADDMEVRGTGTFAPVANTVTLTGDWTMSATGTLTTSGTFIFSGSDAQTISPAGKSFSSITIKNTNAAGASLASDINITGNLYLSADTAGNVSFDAGSSNVTIGDNIDYIGTGDGSENIDMGSGMWSVSGNLDLTDGSIDGASTTLILNGSTSQEFKSNSQSVLNLTITNTDATTGVTLSDDLTVSGTFADETASSKISFGTGNTFTIENITLNGQASGSKITLASSTPGTSWNLAVSGTQSISYVSVSDSNASGGSQIAADDGTNYNGGNNINWLFPASNKYWVGASSSWNDANNWADSSGSAGGAGVPSTADTAIFDNQDTTDCTLDTDVDITTITNTNYAGTFDAADKTIALSGDLSFKSGTVNLGSGSWSLSGNVDFGGATITNDSSTVALTGTSKTITTGAGSIGDLIVLNSTGSAHTINLSGNVNVDGNLYLAANGSANMTLNAADHDIGVTGNLDFTGIGLGVETLDMGSGMWSVSGNVDLTGGTITADSSTLAMNTAGSKIYGNNQTFYNLNILDNIDLSNSSSANKSFAIDHNLNITAGKTLTLNLHSTVTFNKMSTLTLNTTGTLRAVGGGDIVAIDSAAGTFPSTGTISAPVYFKTSTSDATVPARSYSGSLYFYNEGSTNRTIILGSAAGQTLTTGLGFMIYANGNGNLIVDGTTYNPTVNIGSNSSYRSYFGFFGSGAGSETLNVGSGTWTIGASDIDFRNGTLNSGTSTFIFNRGTALNNQTVYSGSNSFYNITNANTDTHGSDAGLSFLDSVTANTFTYTNPVGSFKTQFKPGITATFTNFNAAGKSNKKIILQPYATNGTWYLKVTNQPTVSFVNVYYSNASGGATIIAYNGTNTDSGNNVNWQFTQPSNPQNSNSGSAADTSGDTLTGGATTSTTATGNKTSGQTDETTVPTNSETFLEINNKNSNGVVVGGIKKVILEGIATAGSTITVMIEGVGVVSTKATEDGSWKVEIPKNPGEYSVKVKAVTPNGSSQEQDVKVKVLGEETKDQNSYYYWLDWLDAIILIVGGVVVFLMIRRFRRRRKINKI